MCSLHICIILSLILDSHMLELAWPRKLRMLLRRQKMVNYLVGWNWPLHKMLQLHQYLILFEIGCPSKVLRDFPFLGFLSLLSCFHTFFLPFCLNIYCVYHFIVLKMYLIANSQGKCAQMRCPFYPLIFVVARCRSLFRVLLLLDLSSLYLVSYNLWMSSDHRVCLLYWPLLLLSCILSVLIMTTDTERYVLVNRTGYQSCNL